jgi:hypothetical protein
VQKHGAMEDKGGGKAVTADKSGKKEEKPGGCANDALAGAQNSAAGPALPPDKGGCKEVTKEKVGKEKKPDKGGDKVVKKEKAGKKEKSGGWVDAALAGQGWFPLISRTFLPNSGLRRFRWFRPLIWDFRLIALFLFIFLNENCNFCAVLGLWTCFVNLEELIF